ncbi:unnamed protein product [Chrysodeixis includens]|uniref:Uncharacterized protein n=1 Tax=Chrysodeixis includens TaxID=689277 RepID=A0A9N8PXK1_CHRIL|nr:unnamed protein product [Chrysodeixis includens]
MGRSFTIISELRAPADSGGRSARRARRARRASRACRARRTGRARRTRGCCQASHQLRFLPTDRAPSTSSPASGARCSRSLPARCPRCPSGPDRCPARGRPASGPSSPSGPDLCPTRGTEVPLSGVVWGILRGLRPRMVNHDVITSPV